MRNPRPCQPGRSPGLAEALWLAAALLLAQALGLAHGWTHGLPKDLHAHAVHAQAVHADTDAQGHEAGSAQCRLIDQLGHADASWPTAPVLPQVLPAAQQRCALPAGRATSATRLAYEARAPPA